MSQSETSLRKRAGQIRLSILEMIVASGSSHIAAAFSVVDILTVLYFDILNINPKKPKWEDRDRFLLSKGHAGAALYATLAHRGFCEMSRLSEYSQNNFPTAGHTVRDSLPGVEVTAGSLGHGLSMGVGMALALKTKKTSPRVFVLVGDGECNEGSVWEASLAAAQFKLDNLVLIVDRNGQQGLGRSDDIMNLEPFAEKWKAFGWHCLQSDGHNFEELKKSFDTNSKVFGKPTVVIAKTIKGKGVSFMEKDPLSWHYKTPKDNFLTQAREDLKSHA